MNLSINLLVLSPQHHINIIRSIYCPSHHLTENNITEWTEVSGCYEQERALLNGVEI